VSQTIDVAIIGAGPYGLSLGSHLRARNIDVRVFGIPMQTWRESMPVGMKLKSEGFASCLSDPLREFTLEDYCLANNIPYLPTGLPVKAATFADYGDAFQKRFIPDLERKLVVSVEPVANEFDLRLDNGEALTARRVIVASGIKAFEYTPPALQGLPSELVTHSAAYGDARHLAGRNVLVIGGGSSATDVAALLRAQGANATLMTRRSTIRFQSPLGERSFYDRLKAPMTGLGPGWKSVLCVKTPLLFHAMPEAFRVDVVRRYLGPAPAWFVRDQVEGHVPYVTQSTITKLKANDAGVHLWVRGDDGTVTEISTHHVIAATGYRVNIDRLTFLGDRIRSSLCCAAGAPVLSRNFESSIPHLYFVGASSANSFGPLVRFAYGADYSARRLSRHLESELRRHGRSAIKSSAL
jgi:thioredoxin reductase